MLFDIFVLAWFICCFHERFSSISTPRNFVIFSLSMTILPIFKKGSGSLKKIFFEAGREYLLLQLGQLSHPSFRGRYMNTG